jgi:nicotinamide riboside kinase
MLIGFIGPAISGKTTTAAKLFAGLKDDGYVAEFLPEQARSYIAHLRYRMGPDFKLELNDGDQKSILFEQYMSEKVFVQSATPLSVIITDCAAFLALLYMTDAGRADPKTLAKARASAARFDLLFRCHPVRPGDLYDPNRVHSFEQSQALDEQLAHIMTLAEVDPAKVVELSGPSHVRASAARYELSERLLCRR